MSHPHDFDARLRAALREPPAIADDGFSARVLAALPAAAPATPLSPLVLATVPLLVPLLTGSGLMTSAPLETALAALLLTGLSALVWLATESVSPADAILSQQSPH
jgi:hypothetical protein